MHLDNLFPVGLPQGIAECVEEVDDGSSLSGGPVRGQSCRIHRHGEFLGFFVSAWPAGLRRDLTVLFLLAARSFASRMR